MSHGIEHPAGQFGLDAQVVPSQLPACPKLLAGKAKQEKEEEAQTLRVLFSSSQTLATPSSSSHWYQTQHQWATTEKMPSQAEPVPLGHSAEAVPAPCMPAAWLRGSVPSPWCTGSAVMTVNKRLFLHSRVEGCNN